MALEIELFTDPACPFAFSAEPIRQRLRWHYGDQLRWRVTMIVLTLEPGEAEKLQEGAPGLQKRFGMPIDPASYPVPSSSEPACRAVVAARLNAPEAEQPLLRRLRVRRMAGGLLDDPALIAAAAADIGLDPVALARWADTPAVEDALRGDIARSRNPTPAARALWTTSSAGRLRSAATRRRVTRSPGSRSPATTRSRRMRWRSPTLTRR